MERLDVGLFKGFDEVERRFLEKLYSMVKEHGKVEWAQLPPELRMYLKSKGYSKITVDENFIAKILQSSQKSTTTFEMGGTNVPKSQCPEVSQGTLGHLSQGVPSVPSVPTTYHDDLGHLNVIMKAIQKIIPKADRPYKRLAFYVLYKNKEVSEEQLRRDVYNLSKMVLNQELSDETIRKAISAVRNSDVVLLGKDEAGIVYYTLKDSVREELAKEIKLRIMEAEKEAELEAQKVSEYESMVQAFMEFFRNHVDGEGRHIYMNKITDLLTVKKSKSLEIDFAHLNSYNSTLAEKLLDHPEEVILAAEEALRRVLEEDFFKKDKWFHARFYNLPKTLLVKQIGSEHINKFIQVEGIVSRQVEHKPYVSKAVFICADCGNEMTRLQKPYASIVKPPKCDQCGSKNIVLDVDRSTFINAQYFKIQDLPDAMIGTNARDITCIVLDDLVDTFLPGDRVRVTGILRVVLEKKNGLPIFKKVLEVNHIDVITKQIKDIELSQHEVKQIEELAKRPDIVDLITKSIAPSIYGYYEIKKGIALALFSEGDWVAPDGTVTRGRSHVLLVGDPGTAKSTISRFLKQVIPRGVWTTAKTSSAAGLTAAATRDELTGSWVLEAGALVLANGGICVIDEFDKMSDKDRAAIHEALEQGTISVSKAGINVTLSAKTTVIAIGNPKDGRFNKMKPFVEQISFPPTLLSRFDLIFVLIDEPNIEQDSKVASHILRYKIAKKKERGVEFIPADLLRKYIAYARQNYDPEFSEEAIETLEAYYVKMRNMAKKAEADGIKPIPITARQLEGLARLAKARARMRLSNTITKEDVEDVIKLMEFCLKAVAMDEEGVMDVSIIEVGKSAKEISKLEKLLDIIEKLQDSTDYGALIDDILEEAMEVGIDKQEARELLKKLKLESRVYEPRNGYYKIWRG